jgi:hypothetical protein
MRPADERLHEVGSNAEQMNAADASQRRRARLKEISMKVRSESMLVNAEFEEIEDTADA